MRLAAVAVSVPVERVGAVAVVLALSGHVGIVAVRASVVAVMVVAIAVGMTVVAPGPTDEPRPNGDDKQPAGKAKPGIELRRSNRGRG
jgi:hypothetical protein